MQVATCRHFKVVCVMIYTSQLKLQSRVQCLKDSIAYASKMANHTFESTATGTINYIHHLWYF